MIFADRQLDTKSDKRGVEKIGRQFTLLFNRGVMYKMDNPFTIQFLRDFYKLLSEELKDLRPIVILRHRERFFMDGEPLDSRLNTSKLLSHFKKGKIHSVSFEQGLTEVELNDFFRIFTNANQFENADAMKKALAEKGVTHVRLNHAFLKKIFVMKRKPGPLMGIDHGKARRRFSQKKKKMRSEADELTSQVIIRLIKEEYKQSGVFVERLAQILQRLVPETGELNRLFPKLKETLLAEGMPFSDFCKLTATLDRGVENDKIVGGIKERSPNREGGIHHLNREITAGSGNAEVIRLQRKNIGQEVMESLVEKLSRHIFEEAFQKSGKGKKRGREGRSRRIFNRKEMFSFIKRETSRSLNHNTSFSIIILSVLRAVPQNKRGDGNIGSRDILNSVLVKLLSIVRDADVVVGGDRSKGVVLLPMMKHDESHVVLRRFLREIHNTVIKVNGWELKIRLGGTVMAFDPDSIPELKD